MYSNAVFLKVWLNGFADFSKAVGPEEVHMAGSVTCGTFHRKLSNYSLSEWILQVDVCNGFRKGKRAYEALHFPGWNLRLLGDKAASTSHDHGDVKMDQASHQLKLMWIWVTARTRRVAVLGGKLEEDLTPWLSGRRHAVH